MKRIVIWSLVMTSLATLVWSQPHHTHDGFRNPFPGFEERGFRDFLKWTVVERLSGEKPERPETYNLPLLENDGAALRNNHSRFTITWIGHSTLLIQMEGVNILTDPIWSERCSPVQFAGPKRHVPPGVAFEDLPEIDLVIISHDHYDHLDKETIKKLGNKPLYLVPLRVGAFLDGLGIDHYEELDWGDALKIDGLNIICTPAQHFSGRGLFDRNATLWASWVIKGERHSVYFGGDSGYFPGYQEIARDHGPFDVAALPIGAYLPRWFMSPVHMDPAEAVQAFLDLNAQFFVPIHWGTFELADEPLDEPPVKLMESVSQKGLSEERFLVLKHGETHRVVTDSVMAGTVSEL